MGKNVFGPEDDLTTRFYWEGFLDSIHIDVRNHVVVKIYSSMTGDLHRHNYSEIKPILALFYKVDRCDFIDCFNMLSQNEQNPAYSCMKDIMDKERKRFLFY